MLGFVETLLDRLFDYIGGKELHNVCTYFCPMLLIIVAVEWSDKIMDVKIFNEFDPCISRDISP